MASGILLAIAWLSQSALAAQLGIPAELRAWAPVLAAATIALVVLPLVLVLLSGRRR